MQFTKEQLIEEAKQSIKACHTIMRVSPNIDAHKISLRLAEIALASLDAEPMFYVDGEAAKRLIREHTRFATITNKPKKGATLPLYIAPPAPDNKQMDELVMWVKRLAHSLKNARPDSSLHRDAMDYLCSKGLISVGDVLR
ncbi:hypothetical protein OGW18_20790 [Citrobacter sp. CK184]|uniref:hypothetical protein n=1 Tax=unclassified Citrobacter TaxID=2644389 RepID=UPI0025749138|nr:MULTISPECIES: hypothetical protein [unclassified Citrobacter]MDM3030194.1 hypothetical protein [Citrobacter sp. CK185]MDM3048738.1 hypothetical protein [Citrobacter sp. CK184]